MSYIHARNLTPRPRGIGRWEAYGDTDGADRVLLGQVEVSPLGTGVSVRILRDAIEEPGMEWRDEEGVFFRTYGTSEEELLDAAFDSAGRITTSLLPGRDQYAIREEDLASDLIWYIQAMMFAELVMIARTLLGAVRREALQCQLFEVAA